MAREKLDQLISSMRVLTELAPGMPIAKALSLLVVARNQGMGVQDIANEAGLLVPNVSRYIVDWRTKAGGFEFIRVEEDPTEIRKKPMYLTTKGQKFIDKVLGVK